MSELSRDMAQHADEGRVAPADTTAGWIWYAANDPAGRRGLWARRRSDTWIDLCSGREGDDGFVRLGNLPKDAADALIDVLEHAMPVEWEPPWTPHKGWIPRGQGSAEVMGDEDPVLGAFRRLAPAREAVAAAHPPRPAHEGAQKPTAAELVATHRWVGHQLGGTCIDCGDSSDDDVDRICPAILNRPILVGNFADGDSAVGIDAEEGRAPRGDEPEKGDSR